MTEKYCQSCAMPMGNNKELYGTNEDGSKNEDYCQYCYQKGVFTANVNMEEMIEICIPHMLAAHPDMTAEKARSMMQAYLPQLKRWQQK